jgi:hypothetical protein
VKLLFCTFCHDMVKLHNDHRTCDCGQSWGQYEEDDLHATVGGKALVIGIENTGLRRALFAHEDLPTDQYTLACWLFPRPHRNVTYDDAS